MLAPDFRHIIDSLNTAVVQVDAQLRILHMNPAAEMLFAVSNSLVQGSPITHYFREHEHTAEELKAAAHQPHNYTRRQTHWQLQMAKTSRSTIR